MVTQCVRRMVFSVMNEIPLAALIEKLIGHDYDASGDVPCPTVSAVTKILDSIYVTSLRKPQILAVLSE